MRLLFVLDQWAGSQARDWVRHHASVDTETARMSAVIEGLTQQARG